MVYDVEKAKEMADKFLQELDAFVDQWIEAYKMNNLPIGQVGGLIRDYGAGEIEDIPGPLVLKSCPRCKTKPADLEWMDYEEEHFVEDGQEYVKQGGFCQCDEKENDAWIVTYKLLPIKMVEQ